MSSSSDSDWGSDSDSDSNDDLPSVLPPVPVATPTKPKTKIPAQQVFLAFPVQLFLQSSVVNSRPRLAGATIIYTHAQETWQVFFYDQNRRPIIVVELGPVYGSTSKKSKGWKAPCDFLLYDGDDNTQMSSATIIDQMKRPWRVVFQSRLEAFRFLTFLAISMVCVRAGKTSSEPYCVIDVMKGKGKSCKPKQYAQCAIRVWRLEINSEEPNMHQPIPPHMANFDPKYDDTCSLFNEEFENIPLGELNENDTTDKCPQTLGDIIKKMKIGGQTLFAIPAECKLARYLIENIGENIEDICKPGYIFIGSITVLSSSKKKKRKSKKKKEKKEEKKETITNDAQIPAANQSAVQQKIVKDQHEDKDSSSSDEDNEMTPAPASVAVPNMTTGMNLPTGLPIGVSSLPSMQSNAQIHGNKSPSKTSNISASFDKSKIKKISRDLEIFTGALGALITSVKSMDLTQKQILRSNIKTTYSNLSKSNLFSQSQQKVIQEHLVQLLTVYGEKNQLNVSGTMKHTEDSTNKCFKTIRPLISTGGIFSKQSLHKLQKSKGDGQIKKKTKEFDSELEKLRRKIQTLEKENDKLSEEKESAMSQLTLTGEKLIDLAQIKFDMQDQIPELEKKLKEKTVMTNVFEQGSKDYRKLYENEIEKKTQLEEEIIDLRKQQKIYKRTWIPHKAVTHCMSCNSYFEMFGKKSRSYCRYCGRLFCGNCTTKMKIPEFGFNTPVPVCKNCEGFKE